ncbi:MAG: valine--tRNA ligase [Deltaproteobacteria bacterium]|nr:valine--tRNA ligase [Deltaproteobacteria bacterium]
MTSQLSELPKTYAPETVERQVAELWLEKHAFDANPDDRPRDRRYVIMMPLPNVTGALHMGHAMDNVMQDLLTRWHRMAGDNTLWMPGTDHAGIATQAVIEKRLKEFEGLTRHDVGREGLIERIWQWKDQYEKRIISQQQVMGCSCDWRRHRFTMDAVCARAVRHAFFRLFADGLIFRGKRLVNWDVYLQTSVSDDEVYHETVAGNFWHLRYPFKDPRPGEPDAVIVATTRPETMLGDTAVAVHPDPEAALNSAEEKLRAELAKASAKEQAGKQAALDALIARRESHLPQLIALRDMARAGRTLRLPLVDREIPLICDVWAKPELGSGCVKITPAHDPNDYDVWQRNPEIGAINILNPDGTLNQHAGSYAGLSREAARQRVVEDLEQQGLLEAVEERQVDIGHSDRSKTPIEPYLSDQWFVAMGDQPGGVLMGRDTARSFTAAGLVQAAIDAVEEGRVKIHPARYTKTYIDWLSEKRDWPISRQLWWGHRIPVWRKTDSGALELPQALTEQFGRRVVGRLERHGTTTMLRTVEDIAHLAGIGGNEQWSLYLCPLDDESDLVGALEQGGFTAEQDVLDTWFSSALWPFSTLGWPDPQTAALNEGQAPTAAQGDRADALDYYYPGSCLVTGRDIITLWVARMVIAGLYALGDVPFADVFIHANIQDGKGKRMSKSAGNGIDPVDICNRYGTDAMRFVLCDMQTGSQDIRLPVTADCPTCGYSNDLGTTEHGQTVFTYVCGKSSVKKKGGCGAEFDVLGTMAEMPAAQPYSERFDIGRSFCTKLWNSARFAFLNLDDVPDAARTAEELKLEDRWILDGLDQAVRAVQQGLSDYNPSLAINAAREFFWSELCDWYLELIKPRLAAGGQSGALARQVLAFCLDQVLRLFHPFVPFITEHLWQRLNAQVPVRGLGPWAQAPASDVLITAAWPVANDALAAPDLRALFGELQGVTRAVRELRQRAGVSPRQALKVTIKAPTASCARISEHADIVKRLANVSELIVDPNAERTPGAASRFVSDLQVFVHDVIDDEVERNRLVTELKKVEKELALCDKKLGNQAFVGKAPAEVVDEIRQRQQQYQVQKDELLEGLEALA